MRVLVGTPSHQGTVCCDYAVAMCEVFRLAKDRGHQINIHFRMYQSLVQKARNTLFKKAYIENYDALVWIDADQGFKADAFFKLLEHPVDVVGIPVRMKTDEERYNIRPEDPLKHKWDNKLELMVVQAIGTGFLKLSRKAIEALWERGDKYFADGEEHRMICNLEIKNGGLISEDIQICERLQEAGFNLYADIETTADHFGTKRFSANYLEHCLSKSDS